MTPTPTTIDLNYSETTSVRCSTSDNSTVTSSTSYDYNIYVRYIALLEEQEKKQIIQKSKSGWHNPRIIGKASKAILPNSNRIIRNQLPYKIRID